MELFLSYRIVTCMSWVMAKVTVDTQGVTYPEPEKLADPFGR